MSYSRDRKIFHQFEFAPVTGPTGVSILEPIGTRDIVVQKPDPEWLTLSATGLVSLAAALDDEHNGNARPPLSLKSILSRHAGSALHRIRELMTIYEETLPADAASTDAAWENYGDNLDIRLPQLLPTTPPHHVKKLRHVLEDRALVFPHANDHPPMIEAGYRYIANKVLDAAQQGPPLEDTYPLPADEQHGGEGPVDPDVLETLWTRVTLPHLRSLVEHLIQWHEGSSQVLGRSLSKPTEGMINGLPELTAVIKVPSLQLTLVARTDETTRWSDPHHHKTVTVTDLKSGPHVPVPPEGSFEQTADQLATYLLAIAMVEVDHPFQEKDGYALEYRTDTGIDNPRTTSLEDQISFPVVALGQYPPEVVDKAKQYESILTDPIAAQTMLGKTEDLLDRIRKERQKRKPHG